MAAAKWKTLAMGVVIVGAGALAIALVSGVLYEQAQRARDRERFPQIGRSVDIGGRMLNLYCSGAGQPTVIFESGSPWPLWKDPKTMFANGAPHPGYSWVAVQRELAKLTTACWYDRAGSGWSDLGPYPRDSAAQARDLHTLLQTAGVSPPYVLVAETSAALDARVYTGLYPADVSGLVLVNGVHPDFLIRTRPGMRKQARMPEFVGHSQDLSAQVFNQIGLFRLGTTNRPAPGPAPKGMTEAEWNTIWRLTQSSKARSALIQDIASWGQSMAETRAAGGLGDRPVFVLSSENAPVASEYDSVWVELQNDLAHLSTRGKRVLVSEGSDEMIYQAPDAIVEAVRQVLGNVHSAPSR